MFSIYYFINKWIITSSHIIMAITSANINVVIRSATVTLTITSVNKIIKYNIKWLNICHI